MEAGGCRAISLARTHLESVGCIANLPSQHNDLGRRRRERFWVARDLVIKVLPNPPSPGAVSRVNHQIEGGETRCRQASSSFEMGDGRAH